MTKSQARGYLLEIVLSKLIEVNGYEVIIKEDGHEVVKKYNGLNVKGRGGFHQFDTLGKFKITPPFMYPLRLFVEAKFYSDSRKVGIDKVRMGVGILEDLNTNYSTVDMNDEELSIEKYQYHYAIFSASGFTEDAQRFAIAHKIHLIDLSGTEYSDLLDLIDQVVDDLDSNTTGGNNNIPKDVFSSFKDDFYNGIIETDINLLTFVSQYTEINKLRSIINFINDNVIYMAMINSPYMIPLFSNVNLNNELQERPHQNITIIWTEENPKNWEIRLGRENEYSLSFSLPDILSRYLFSSCNNLDDTAMNIKENHIGKIVFIAYFNNVNPTICTLTFDRNETLRLVEDMNN